MKFNTIMNLETKREFNDYKFNGKELFSYKDRYFTSELKDNGKYEVVFYDDNDIEICTRIVDTKNDMILLFDIESNIPTVNKINYKEEIKIMERFVNKSIIRRLYDRDLHDYSLENACISDIERLHTHLYAYTLDNEKALKAIESYRKTLKEKEIETIGAFRLQEAKNNDEVTVETVENNTNIINDIITCDNDLEYDVFKDIFLDECECYDTLENIINGIDNGEFYPKCGCVGALVYYEQTSNIFRNYYDEILEVANNYQQESGGVLELDVNTLVWFAWNETVNKWYIEILDYLQ